MFRYAVAAMLSSSALVYLGPSKSHAANVPSCTDADYARTWEEIIRYNNSPTYVDFSLCDGSIISKIEIFHGKTHVGGMRLTITQYGPTQTHSDPNTPTYIGTYEIGNLSGNRSFVDLGNATVKRVNLQRSNGAAAITGFYVEYLDQNGQSKAALISANEHNGTSTSAIPSYGKLIGLRYTYNTGAGYFDDFGFIFMDAPDTIDYVLDPPNEDDVSDIEAIGEDVFCKRILQGESYDDTLTIDETVTASENWYSETSATTSQTHTVATTYSTSASASIESVGSTSASTETTYQYTTTDEKKEVESNGGSQTTEKSIQQTRAISWTGDLYSELVDTYMSNGTLKNYEVDAVGNYVFCNNYYYTYGYANADGKITGRTIFGWSDRSDYVMNTTGLYTGSIVSEPSSVKQIYTSICVGGGNCGEETFSTSDN